MATVDQTRKIMFPNSRKAMDETGPPRYWQHWLEEGIAPMEREYVGSTAGFWTPALAEYVDYCFQIPTGAGFALPAADYALALAYSCEATEDEEIGITLSYRCDSGSHVDTASEVLLPSTGGDVAIITLPLTVTAYTATSTAVLNVLVTTDDTGAGNIAIYDVQAVMAADAAGLYSTCFGVDTGEADTPVGWERPPVAVTLVSPASNCHSAPVLVNGPPSFVMYTEGLYPGDTFTCLKYSDSSRSEAHDAADGRSTTTAYGLVGRFIGLFNVSAVGGYNKVTRTIEALTFGDTDAPDACRNIAPDATTWEASTAYSEDDYVIPTTPNEHVYQAGGAGTSAATEPAWPTDGTTATDNDITWTDVGERYEYGVNTYYTLVFTDFEDNVLATVGVETLLDLNSPLSVASTALAPTLSAVANSTTKDSITTSWTDNASWTDPQPLGYEIHMTMADGTIIQKIVGTRNDFIWHYLPVGTYSWKVRAIDPWGSVSDWTTADSFDITLSGTNPTCILDALPTVIWAQPLTRWTWYDPDGDVQTDYEVELYDDAAYSSNVYDSGTVTSAVLQHQHTGLAAGTYYRRVRIRTASTDWSDWAMDSFAFQAATTQSSAFDLYRMHPDGTKSKIYQPLSSVQATQRLDGAGEFSFVVDNFQPFVERDIYGCWHFDETSGAVAHDIVGGHDLTLADDPAWTDGVLNLTGTEYGQSADLDLDLADDFTAYLVCYPSATTGTLLFLGAYANDANYFSVQYTGAGTVRLVAGGAVTSGNLDVPADDWVLLRLRRADTVLSLSRRDTAATVSVAPGSYTGTPRLAVGRYAGLTPAGIVDAGKVAGLLLYTDDLT